MIMELSGNLQITLPKEIVENLGLREGDKFDISERNGVIHLMPIIEEVEYPKEYIDMLNAEVSKAKADKSRVFDNADDLLKHLNS